MKGTRMLVGDKSGRGSRCIFENKLGSYIEILNS